MVRIQGQSEYERLDALIQELSTRHGFELDMTGWTRKTYDVFRRSSRRDPREPMARIESFATTNGEITVFSTDAMAFAEELGAALEAQFDVAEAVIVQANR